MTAVDERTVLALTGVRKSYVTPAGPLGVLDGVDLTVARGEVLAVAGRSGSGKTTLLTLIAGWERPDAGTVDLQDGDPASTRPGWSQLAILPQSLGLLDELTVAENVTFPLRGAAQAPAGDPAELMDTLGIAHLGGRHPDEVSLGEQQRAALARALVVQPQLLVADEPISHQDRDWGRTMMRAIGAHAAGGMACVLATHNDIAFEAAHRVLELRDGRLVPRG